MADPHLGPNELRVLRDHAKRTQPRIDRRTFDGRTQRRFTEAGWLIVGGKAGVWFYQITDAGRAALAAAEEAKT